jgi:hypothetical protein
VRRGIGWLLLAVAVLGGAAAQGLLAAPGLGRIPDGLFALEAVASVIVLWAEIAVATVAAHAVAGRAAAGRPAWGPVLAWSAIVVVLVMGLGILLPYALPLAAVAALCVLPAAAGGRWNALAGFRVFRRPWSAIAAAVVTIVAVVLSAVVALLAGFFLTGTLGGWAMWLWFGAAGTLLLLWWTRLARAPR